MYFLNGDRLYIKPQKACGTLDDQLMNCLTQLTQINSGKKVFKLNFFVDVESDEVYDKWNSKIRLQVSQLFSEKIILNLIAQPPLTCKIIVEVFLFNPLIWTAAPIIVGANSAIIFKHKNSEIMVGNVQSNENIVCKAKAEKAFNNLKDIFREVNFPIHSIVRQWNYLEDIVGFEGDKQKYQEFNNVRSAFYGNNFENTGYPAGTGIGMNRGGIIIEFVAVKSKEAKTLAIDNPGQIAAHSYSKNVLIGEKCVLQTTPKFERARYFELHNKKLIFISGTASIVGEKTVGVGNPIKQTETTIQNIQLLYSTEILHKLSEKELRPKYGHARVYVKRRKDFAAIKKTFKKHFGNLPVVYIVADICRYDLLVEVEGKVILK